MNNYFVELGFGVVPWYFIVAAAVGAYFLGNINPAILIGRARGIDIRAQGSGNAGATNALRSLGKKAGIATFLIDALKGWAGFAIPHRIFLQYVFQDEMIYRGGFLQSLTAVYAVSSLAMLCGLCTVLGHMYPAVFGFRGGKGVSTVFGALLAFSWLFALILLAIVIVLTAIFRRVSLSVMIAVAVALVFIFLSANGSAPVNDPVPVNGALLWIVVILALVVWKHRSNIGRLVKGEEPKLSFGKGKSK